MTGTQTRRVEGRKGVRVTEYRVVIEDGVEVETVLVDSYYEPEPIDTVIYYPATATQDLGFGADMRVVKVMPMFATWYNAASSGKPEDHPAYGITTQACPSRRASWLSTPLGHSPWHPNVHPRLRLCSLAADTGGGIMGNMIDLGYPDGMEVDWYTGWTDVYILAP